jgi:hypothetical protein
MGIRVRAVLRALAAHRGPKRRRQPEDARGASSPYKKYSLADIALLEDPAKHQFYMEAHTRCIAPRYREVAAIFSTKSALIENPPPSYFDGIFSADEID